MARPKSNDKRNAIMNAAVRVIVSKGLGAPTATIAKEAGISNGSLFTYFETKADLFNQLYLELKSEMAGSALDGFPAKASLRKQAFHVWTYWMRWAVANPDRRRALARLAVYDQITPETRAAGNNVMSGLLEVMERIRSQGALKDAAPRFAGALVNSLGEATMDFMINDPDNAEKHLLVGFETFWRALR